MRQMHSANAFCIAVVIALRTGVAAFDAQSRGRRVHRALHMAEVPVANNLQVGRLVGSGSYGTVHLCTLDGETRPLICKRAWTKEELSDQDDPEYKESRCRHYFRVEQHLFEKMERGSGLVSDYIGSFQDTDGREWMTFALVTAVGTTDEAAPTVSDVILKDSKNQHESNLHDHHLYNLQTAMGLGEDATFVDTLDAVLLSLLQTLNFIHSQKIIHRDVKPGNLICDASSKSLVLIDFGSGADLEPRKMTMFGRKKRVGLEDGSSVAVSPIYAAPEVFVREDRSAYQFDVFSSALVFSQLLFNCLDERTDAGFHQQLQDTNWDLDAWLSRELSSKVRPVGLEDALSYLAERRGLWGLLGAMFRADPDERIKSSKALKVFRTILAGNGDQAEDGPFFQSVKTLMDCELKDPPSVDFVSPRPLHFLASFRRGFPLGLVLSEVGEEVDLEGDDLLKWKEAVKGCKKGDVLVKQIIEGGQADDMGIFELGDKLQGVGDLPLRRGGGFEAFVDMLDRQPRRKEYVKVHFARQSERPPVKKRIRLRPAQHARVVDEGAFSLKGRRTAQEDAFVLHDIQSVGDVLVAGVFDGHGGSAASTTAARLMPNLMTEELLGGQVTPRQALELAWETTCDTYRGGCDTMGNCLAEYDAVEGILLANTAAADIVAGTTASVAAIQGADITILNCGDSRTLLVANNGNVEFVSKDHSPYEELDRLLEGSDAGLDYSIPECSFGKWYMPMGELTYAVSRSLEGSYVTSKGIISDPDVTSLRSIPGVLVIASDGLFEVMDNAQVARQAARIKRRGIGASEAAKLLCAMAFDKGTSDNVSVVVVYLDG